MKIAEFTKLVRGGKLLGLLNKTMKPAEIVHSGHKKSLYAYEIDIELDKGLGLSGRMIKSIREWIKLLEVVKKEADGMANAATKLSEN